MTSDIVKYTNIVNIIISIAWPTTFKTVPENMVTNSV